MKKRILSLLLAFLMIVSLLPTPSSATDSNTPENAETTETAAPGTTIEICGTCGNEPCTCQPEEEPVEPIDDGETISPYHANIGKKAKFNPTIIGTEEKPGGSFPISDAPENESDWFSADQLMGSDVSADLVVVIVNVYDNGSEYWYKVAAEEGHTLPEALSAQPWVFQNLIGDSPDYDSLIIIEEEPETGCPICGQTGCTTEHTWCEICGEYCCGISHLYCNVCEIYGCTRSHVWCGTCGDYDCGMEHENVYKPVSAPVIPENPVLTDGADVSIVDEYGDPVTEEGFFLSAGMKASLSAWPTLAGEASYQWQVCYDRENDLWVDIQGQTGKGILLSPAMFLSIAGDQGTAMLRCAVTLGEETQTSAAVPVTVVEPMAVFSFNSASNAAPLAETEDPGDLNKAYVVVQYVYSDDRTAAATAFMEIVPGEKFSYSVDVPEIPGYKATLEDASQYGDHASIQGNVLTLNYAEGELTEEYTIVTVEYIPDYVNYTVIHYWQNVGDDNYTEHQRETISTTHRTGEVINDVHKAYPGFYNLLYETPAAAADGSTVIEVYYDRYYYLMKFELDGGYGVDPIYARYGAPIEIGTPTRAGYGFEGWLDENGNAVTIPDTMPVGGGTYSAKWNPQDTEYTVAYWIKDGDSNIYLGSQILGAQSGTSVSGEDDLTINTNTCGMPAHTHDASCAMLCVLNEHTHGDGKCLYNCGITYHDHTSGCNCTTQTHTTHTRTCYNFTSADVSSNTSNNYGDYYAELDGFNIYRRQTYYGTSYYVQIGNNYYQIQDYSTNTSLAYTLTCHVHSDACCDIAYHDHSNCTCIVTPHIHQASCYSCGAIAHTHTDACKSDLAKYVDYIDELTDKEVTVKGDGSTVVNVYYEYRTYTIRFIYAKQNATGNGYQIASKTGNGYLEHEDGCDWTGVNGSLPTFKDPSGQTEPSTVVIDGNTYYYISLQAKFGADIADVWPSANMGNAGNWEWGSWAAAPGTGYRIKYGDDHANIVGPYPVMSADMIVDNPEKLADDTYLAQNMVAWWGGTSGWYDSNIAPHAYHNYFELLPGEDTTDAVLYNGKYYKLVETYTFTAAHNGDTRVDPIFFNGFQCINDSRDTDNDTQANSKNFDNDGNCEICGDACNYCNTFYYDRNMHKLYFWNYNGPLMEGTGSDVMYGTSLVNHGAYVSTEFMNRADNYPEGLEPGAFQFAGWYTTAECYDGTEMDWTITMPDADMTVYAKWVPVSRAVRFFLDRASLDENKTIPEEMAELYAAANNNAVDANSPYVKYATRTEVPNGSYISDLTPPGVAEGYKDVHPYNGFDFVGWFYLNDAGEETAFDPENMPVHQDLDLYAKWSSNVLCQYNVYFALDADKDGIADVDEKGNIIYIADHISGSAIAGRTYTFTAKGGEDLYKDYQEGWFPTVGSHSIVIDITDVNGTGANSFTFLYQQTPAVPYTVRYLEAGTGKVLDTEKTVSENKNIVVTENFVYIQGYMPDAYQKTLVVTVDGENVITFWYTADTQHALYVVNYYIEQLDADLKHAGWAKYTDLQYTGDIGKPYSANAITIDGFTLSTEYTDLYNVTNKNNGMTGAALPAAVGALSGGKLTGTLAAEGMELNFYYTRNLYPYEFRFMLNGTTTELAPPEVGKAGYDSIVSMGAKEIVMDLDGDGIPEDYRLYDPTENTKDIHIIVDGDPLSADATVTEGQATVNVATFYYVRCTQTMTIKKQVVDEGTDTHPDPNQEFTIRLLIHAQNGYHQSSYEYTKSDGTTGTLSPVITAPNTLQFTLKAGETITIEGLPTAEYTVEEVDLPTGYYDTYAPAQKNKLTVDSKLDVTVTNTYDPAVLEISKTVDVVEDDLNTPEVELFEFTITVPEGVAGTFAYTVGGDGHTATVTGGKMTIYLKNGETARFVNLPVGSYTVTETDYSAQGYKSNYSVNGAAYTEGRETAVPLERGRTQSVSFKNMFPVGDLTIQKTVTKEFYGTPWNGDTFTFAVERTSKALIPGNIYNLEVDGFDAGTAVVQANGTMQVTITFSDGDAAMLTTKDASVLHTLVIKNLPAGTYEVTETADREYVQTPNGLTVSNLVIPAEETKAEFANKLIRPTGSLYLEKELVVLEGYYPEELPPDTEFQFTIELTEEPPSGNLNITVVKDGVSSQVTMTDGVFTISLKANQSVTISGLPIGRFRITEATKPYYANDFAHAINGDWVPQVSTSTEDGRMYTEIQVRKDETAKVKCTNTYPVDRAELIIQKLVTKEYDRDTSPDDSFTFTVTLAEQDIESYSYTVYDVNGKELSTSTAQVTDKQFEVTLKAGQYVVIPNMPVCGYTVTENASSDYTVKYEVYLSETGETVSTTANAIGLVNQSGSGTSVKRTFSAGKTDAVVFTNQYKKHLGQLTITKTVTGTPAETDTFLFHITGNGIDMDVTITGSGSVTVYDLPLDEYTVTEDTSWNWRYTPDSTEKTVTLTVDETKATVEFINTYKEENPWLNVVTNVVNLFLDPDRKEDQQ